MIGVCSESWKEERHCVARRRDFLMLQEVPVETEFSVYGAAVFRLINPSQKQRYCESLCLSVTANC